MSTLDAMVEVHSAAVWRTVFRLLNHEEDARDCYQETFLAALRLDHPEDVRYWRTVLIRIATRRAIDRLRQRYRNEKSLSSIQLTSDKKASVEAPDDRAQDEELRDHVRRALAGLPPQQAEAFWLRHLEQLSPHEVAKEMQIDPGHVRVLVHRAAVRLREILGPSHGPASLSDDLP